MSLERSFGALANETVKVCEMHSLKVSIRTLRVTVVERLEMARGKISQVVPKSLVKRDNNNRLALVGQFRSSCSEYNGLARAGSPLDASSS
jgi:hypothetical protein